MRVGVDVGGTNTDAVLVNGDRVVAWCKKPTALDVGEGIVSATKAVLDESGVEPAEIRCVMIGTTHFTNAIVERRRLLEVGVIRICLPAARGIPPLLDWPDDIRAAIGDHCYLVGGGYQYDGRTNSVLDERAVARAAADLHNKGVKAVAISALFSTVSGDMEIRAQDIVRDEMEDVSITLSHMVGRAGLLERENAAVLNASLTALSRDVVGSIRSALRELDVEAPVYISQNDGTLMNSEYVEQYPILTFASGPTNSMRGAAYLSGKKDALVVDIGGTTTDVGMLTNGFPRESSLAVDIGGVRTNFRMPDVLSLGLGGGSKVFRVQGNGDVVGIGPQSVGYRLSREALIFGGDTLTASDIAVAAGYANFGDRSLVRNLSTELVGEGVDRIHQIVAEGVDRMKTNAEPIPLILVGGGSVLIDGGIAGASDVIVPEHAGVANAIGAAIAQVSGEVDIVTNYDDNGRDAAIARARQDAISKAAASGAIRESIEVLDVEETPLSYAPQGTVRLRVKVAGDLDAMAAGPVKQVAESR